MDDRNRMLMTDCEAELLRSWSKDPGQRDKVRITLGGDWPYAAQEVLAYHDELSRLRSENERHKKRWTELREHIADTGEFELSAGRKLSGYLCRDLVAEMDALARGDGAG